ncbi:MAG: hypothetical protein ACLUD0_05040 [Eubacterium ramulus]
MERRVRENDEKETEKSPFCTGDGVAMLARCTIARNGSKRHQRTRLVTAETQPSGCSEHSGRHNRADAAMIAETQPEIAMQAADEDALERHCPMVLIRDIGRSGSS